MRTIKAKPQKITIEDCYRELEQIAVRFVDFQTGGGEVEFFRIHAGTVLAKLRELRADKQRAADARREAKVAAEREKREQRRGVVPAGE